MDTDQLNEEIAETGYNMNAVQILEKDVQMELIAAEEAQNIQSPNARKSKKRELADDVQTAEINCKIMSSIVNCVEHFDIKAKRKKTKVGQHVKKFLVDGDGPGYKYNEPIDHDSMSSNSNKLTITTAGDMNVRLNDDDEGYKNLDEKVI